MNSPKWLILSSTFLLFGVTATSFANSVPTSQCVHYLNYSNFQFNTVVSKNQGTATTIANILGECQIANACSSIKGLDHCSTTLANRYFTSEYYANYNPSSANNFGSSSGSSRGSSASSNSGSSSKQQKAEIITNPKPTNRQTPTNNNQSDSNANSSSSSSIHWF